MSSTVSEVRRLDGSREPFEPRKIEDGIRRALKASGIVGEDLASDLSRRVVKEVNETFKNEVPSLEDIQDLVQKVLSKEGYPDAARTYLLFQEQRAEAFRFKQQLGMRDDLGLGVNSLAVLKKHYLARDLTGKVTETPSKMFRRVARTVAEVERLIPSQVDPGLLEEEFYQIMSSMEFLPGSPTLVNAGTPAGQLLNCYVIPVEDSIDGIFQALKDTAKVHQFEGGTGFSFSKLRPRGDIVRSTKGIASGPVSFMSVFDLVTGVMKQAGRLPGANMGILSISHPDIEEFIEARPDDDRLANFHLAVAVTDEFMEAADRKSKWPLVNPRSGQVWKTIKADRLLEQIVTNAWHTGEPGLLFVDELAGHNPTPSLGTLEATGSCGELALLPYESCIIGTVNLAKLVRDGNMDWDELSRVVRLAVRFLDNVIEVNAYPSTAFKEMAQANRKIGLGVMGFADLLVRLGIPYNSEAGLEMGEKVMSTLSEEARRASKALADERGPFPNLGQSIYGRDTRGILRNASLLAVAPTGSLSAVAGCSSGIEPLFALVYARNVLGDQSLIETNPAFHKVACDRGFFTREIMEEVARRGTISNLEQIPEDVRRVFVTDTEVGPEWHLRMQAAFQRHTDNLVIKAVNLPNEATPEDIYRVFRQAHALRCRGVTVYRYGSHRNQSLYTGGHVCDTGEVIPYVTAASEYSGGFLSGRCQL